VVYYKAMTTRTSVRLESKGSVKLRPSPLKGMTKYAGIFEQMNALTPGEFRHRAWVGPRVIVNLAHGNRSINSRTFLNRLASAIKAGMSAGLIKPPPSGYKYVRRTLEGDKQVMIGLAKKG
jgi:hypothetical protein